MSYIYITDKNLLSAVIDDLKEYKKAFKGYRCKLGLDLEGFAGEGIDFPRPIKRPDGTWEGYVRLLQLGLDPDICNRQYIIDVQAVGEEAVTEHFKEFLEKNAILIGQNLKFDLGFLVAQFNIFPEEIRDTMIISQLRFAGDKFLNDNTKAAHRLDALYQRFLDDTLFKTLTGMTFKEYSAFKKQYQVSNWRQDELSEKQLEYACDDVRLIFYLYKAQMENIQQFKKRYPKSGIINVIKLECDCAIEYAIMEVVGMGFDLAYHKNEVIPYLEDKAREAEEELVKIPDLWLFQSELVKTEIVLDQKKLAEYGVALAAIPDNQKWKVCSRKRIVPYVKTWMEFPNLGSNDQLAIVLQNLGFKWDAKTPKGKPKVDRDVLNELFWESEETPAKDILGKILQYRKAVSFLDKYGHKFLDYVHEDGRLHPQWYQLGADTEAIDTGRSSAKEPPVMTIPKRDKLFGGVNAKELFRKDFIATEGRKLYNADFSNEEVRLLAELANDDNLIKSFKENRDLHQDTADFLGLDSRDDGKTLRFTYQYGAGAKKGKQEIYVATEGRINLPVEDHKKLRDKLFEFNSGMKNAIQRHREEVETALAPFDSLTYFTNRRPMFVGFADAPVKDFPYIRHRLWCLDQWQELEANRIKRGEKKDSLARDFQVWDEEKERWTTWGNKWGSKVSAIQREYFNFKVQSLAATVLKLALRDIGRKLRAKYSIWEAAVIGVFHDEFLVDCREDLISDIEICVLSSMNWALNLVLKKVPVLAEGKAKQSWLK